MAEAKTLKVKKKKWYEIIAPRIFRECSIGGIPLDDIRKVVGRVVKVNLTELTNDVKKQNINMKFVIKNVEGDKAITEVIGFEMIPASIRRMVRRGRERIDSSVICFTADGKRIRIKALLLTVALVKGSVKAALIKNLNDYLTKTIKQMSFDTLISELVSSKFQRTMRGYLNKTYPLRTCEIRSVNIEKEKREKIKEEEEKEETKEEKIEEKPKEKKEAEEVPKKEPKEESKEIIKDVDNNAKTSD